MFFLQYFPGECRFVPQDNCSGLDRFPTCSASKSNEHCRPPYSDGWRIVSLKPADRQNVMCPSPHEFTAATLPAVLRSPIAVPQQHSSVAQPVSIIIRQNGFGASGPFEGGVNFANQPANTPAAAPTPTADCTYAPGYVPDGCGFVNPTAAEADLSMANCFQACLDQPDDCVYGVQYKSTPGPGLSPHMPISICLRAYHASTEAWM